MDDGTAETATLTSLWSAIRPGHALPPVQFTGAATLDSPFAVSELAAAAIAVAGLAADDGPVVVDRALADAWFRRAVHPVGWELPNAWDPLSGDYRTADGWIRLHTNAPHHRLAALLALGVTDRSAPRRATVISSGARNLTPKPEEAEEPEPPADPVADERAEREEVVAAVATWRGDELEAEIVEAGGAAAVLRSAGEWAAHSQGVAVAREPLVAWQATSASTTQPGTRVLDLTRVIAGPVATRFLAGRGFEVLRIDPPDWEEPGVVPDMTLGKRTARMNLVDAGALRKLTALIEQADVVVHGYRADALERIGLGDDDLARIRPGLVTVAINAYGWSGPWRNRRGFDSLVQMSTGIADNGTERPVPLPVQALDHATGYLAAAAALEGLRRRRETGLGQAARVSLARTARELVLGGELASSAPVLPAGELETPWGAARLLASPLTIDGAPVRWVRGPQNLGTDKPLWS